MVADSNLVVMPAYLAIGSIANIYWCWRAVGDVREHGRTAASMIALALSISSLIWVLFCFAQCFALLISGPTGRWWDVNTATGCDIMGFYSIFASVSSQLLVTAVAWVSWRAGVKQNPVATTCIVKLVAACFCISFTLALLPLIGVGNYTNTGEGFCYFDWSNVAHVFFMEAVTIPCISFSAFFFVKLARATTPPTLNPARWWYLFAASFAAAWFLWIPAALIGLGSDSPFPGSFPDRYMIIAGVMGHMQPLINVYLYGVVWRRAFVLDGARPKSPKSLQVVAEVCFDDAGDEIQMPAKVIDVV